MKFILIICCLLIFAGCKKNNLSDANNVSNTDGFVINIKKTEKTESKLKEPVFKFDGSTNLAGNSGIVLEAENLPTGNYVRTIKLRVKPETLTGTLFSYGKKDKQMQFAISFKSNGTLFFWGWYCDAAIDVKLPLNKWSDIALTYDGLKIKVFIDNKKVCDKKLELKTAASNKVILGEKFKGEISNVEIFNFIEKKFKPESNWKIRD